MQFGVIKDISNYKIVYNVYKFLQKISNQVIIFCSIIYFQIQNLDFVFSLNYVEVDYVNMSLASFNIA